ncbi:hypothetical protein [Pseudomonas sp. AU12215]|uniref:hypothetical protein n=1 Tax=Pseudomonas sp. AU12215 TaxID=1860123 RepID=UPI000AEF2E3D|nr:hypothetical protein [Pseudomonas sp. AU12215]
MSQANPFIPPGREYGSVDTESRLRALEDFDLEQCRAALALPGLQKTVEKKLRTRIRALEKLETTAEQASGTGISEYDALFAAISSAVQINTPRSLSISVDRFKRCVADFGFSVAALAQPSTAPELVEDRETPEVVAHLLWPLKGSMAGQRFTGLGGIPADANHELYGFETLMTVAQNERMALERWQYFRRKMQQMRDLMRGMRDRLNADQARLTELEHKLKGQWTYASDQATHCAGCGKLKHTPLRVDWMGGYVCLTCIDEKLEALHEAIQAGQVPEECPHLILFDDADVKPIMFAGSGARRAALTKWEQVSINWNAHLFVRIEKNCRDDRYPCATLASTPEQGGE